SLAAAGAGTARRLRAALRRGLGAARRRRQRHAGAARLRQADGDRLLRRSRAVFALANVMDLLADELTRLRARRLPLPFVAPRPLDRLLLGLAPPPSSRRRLPAAAASRRPAARPARCRGARGGVGAPAGRPRSLPGSSSRRPSPPARRRPCGA